MSDQPNPKYPRHTMRHLLTAALLALCSATLLAQFAPNVVETKPLSPEDEAKQFVLPPGFEAQLVAADPDIQKPMNLAFDDQGRLWVTDTIEYPWPVQQGKKSRDTVKILEDFGPDGKARKITTFADDLNIPIGVLPLPGKNPRQALVHSIPNVLRLTDTTGKGVADKRETLISNYGFDDTHGMTSAFTVGLDGWIYACHGFRNSSKVKGTDGSTLNMQSGNTYRFRPDGSKLQQWTWGQVNPFGLSLDPYGNLYSADCHSQPIYQLIRGAYYPSFGKPHEGLGYGPEMIVNYRGSTAVCGVAHYAADAFPAKYQGHVFVGDVMTNELVLFELSWTGTTPKAKQTVFMKSKDQWWRPVDIKLGPDGALYVADFYNCIIGHYEVDLKHPKRDRTRGRVWRIVYKGNDHKATPAESDFTKKSVKDLIADLGHPNLTVRTMATTQLVHRGQGVVTEVRPSLKDASAERRVSALWVMERLGSLGAESLRDAAKSDSALERIHAMRVLAERARISDDDESSMKVALGDRDPHVRRAAAEALGQHPRPGNVKPLLKLLSEVPAGDTHLAHTVKVALRRQFLDGANLGEGYTDKDAVSIANIALAVPTPAAAAYLVAHLQKHALNAEFVRHAARYGSKEDVGVLISWARKSRPTDAGGILRALEQGSQQRGSPMPSEAQAWATEVVNSLLGAKAESDVRQGLELLAALRMLSQQVKALELARTKQPDAVRVAAMNALAALDAKKYAPTLGKILADDGASLPVREQAAAILGRVNQPETRKELLSALGLVPSRLQGRITVALSLTREGGNELVAVVESGKASARLLTEKEVVVRLEQAGHKEKVKKLTAGLPAADEKLAKLIAARQKGYVTVQVDEAKGQALFEKHCSNCHQIGGKGAKIGPQLDGIGGRGLERLLEDTLDPNRNVDAAFRQTTIVTDKGVTITGLVLREEGEVVVVADGQGKEVRVAKNAIDKREVSQLSAMPANVGETIPEAEFYQLVGYLLTLKGGK